MTSLRRGDLAPPGERQPQVGPRQFSRDPSRRVFPPQCRFPRMTLALSLPSVASPDRPMGEASAKAAPNGEAVSVGPNNNGQRPKLIRKRRCTTPELVREPWGGIGERSVRSCSSLCHVGRLPETKSWNASFGERGFNSNILIFNPIYRKYMCVAPWHNTSCRWLQSRAATQMYRGRH